MQQPNSPQPVAKVQRATLGFILSLIAGLFIMIQGIVRVIRGEGAIISGVFDEIPRRVLAGLALRHVGVIAIIFGVLILIGAVLIYSPGKETVGGVVVLIFAILSILTGGGFLVGFVLGIVGGVLALTKK